ncbi:MAG: FtsX-like permease family protein [Treponema sp.]|nr:FtsX-like permease family protein [Treponema sp.]
MKFSSLPLMNLLGKKSRSSALFLFALLLSFSIFGGALTLSSLRNGLKSLELRLGADIIVVPYEARTKVSADTILNQGNRSYFYMSRSNLEKVAAIEGVEKVSPQVYMCTMNAGCCSVSLQVIGFDPETDFTIQPWVRESFKEELGFGDILIGSKVTLTQSRSLKFFNKSWNIAAQLEETGTGLDNAVFATTETLDALLQAAKEEGFDFLKDKKASTKLISTIMVKVEDGYDIDSIVSLIQRRVRKTQAVKTKSMTSGIADSLSGFSKVIALLTALVWILCLVILAVVSSLIIGERKKEFAVLRVMGSSRKKLARLVMAESFLVNLAGGISGIALSSLTILPFHSLIKSAIGLPFLLPGFLTIILLGLFSLILSVLCGCLTSSYAAHKIAQIDTGLILREGN